MVLKYNEFIKENSVVSQLEYCILDWDDNILKMHTLLHFEKKIDGEWVDVDITAEQFAEIRKKYPGRYRSS